MKGTLFLRIAVFLLTGGVVTAMQIGTTQKFTVRGCMHNANVERKAVAASMPFNAAKAAEYAKPGTITVAPVGEHVEVEPIVGASTLSELNVNDKTGAPAARTRTSIRSTACSSTRPGGEVPRRDDVDAVAFDHHGSAGFAWNDTMSGKGGATSAPLFAAARISTLPHTGPSRGWTHTLDGIGAAHQPSATTGVIKPR